MNLFTNSVADQFLPTTAKRYVLAQKCPRVTEEKVQAPCKG